ncbi:ankyrin-3-like [Macrosteles quadrilineatus]|uniref:ankyrin-3-like n=1 Tax=Macrosteles quadrilineatus TaxID=74068 RepID=UPI0023E23C94|nr:ankyrin-3-like [Macrosteles quadrilineatus]
MSEKGKLTDLLSEEPLNETKIRLYSRLNKIDSLELIKLAIAYQDNKKKTPTITPLHIACYINTKPEIVKTLVIEGWNVYYQDKEFYSPLEVALECGNISVAKLLITDLGVEVNKFDCNGLTPMYFALSREKKQKTCVSAVKLLLNSGVPVDAIVDRLSESRPIHLAITNYLPSVVSFLLQKGADPNIQDIDGFAPIHCAVIKNHLDIVKLLLLHGVDLESLTKENRTPLCLAVKNENAEIIQELVKGGCNINRASWDDYIAPFHLAVFLNKLELVKLMVSLGANVNLALKYGTTPLHSLATRDLDKVHSQEKEDSHGRIDMAKYLVESGANLNVKDMNGNSPLQVSIISGFLGLAKCFIKLGANVNTTSQNEDSIFHQVIPFNRDIIILLLEFGGDFRAYNINRMTPYHVAISFKVDLKYITSFLKHGCPYDQDLPKMTDIVKRYKVAEKLFASEKEFFKGIEENDLERIKTAVSKGAVVTSCCERMKHPLHFVALHGRNEVLTYLLEKNVQPNTLDKEGRTPLYLAASSGHYQTCHILLRFGACYNHQSEKCQKTPKMIANEQKHFEIVRLFEDVDCMFRKAGSKKPLTSYLKKKISNSFDYAMYLNVINFKGNNLLTTALQNKRNDNVKELLKMRLNFASGC